MRSNQLPAVMLALAFSATLCAAQGSDDCSSASPINGRGTFPFDLTGATTDGLPDSLCDPSGGGQIENDVWFAWTATATEAVIVQTCGLASVDTAIAAYAGTSCPAASILACDDDTCGRQSRVYFDVVAGATYLLRIGNSPGATPGAGEFEVWSTPGGDCNPLSLGPDVITGNLPGIFHWGAVEGVSGYSIGTDACNVGDQPLTWDGATNQHPVIAQNFYRLNHGRFEQVGQSWIKHGFAALNIDSCCTCIDPGYDFKLEVGCSDVYGAVQNGGQAELGPRWEVNPHTGEFPYPFTTMDVTGDAIYKRIQIDNGDLDPALQAGARFFGEGHYVAPGDALSGNGNNNASYREAEVGSFQNGGWSLALVGETHRRSPAIQAWQDQIPAVQLEHVQVPDDGLFIVGSLCTDNGDGTWHYEYAVYNMNASRAAGAFQVPVPAAVLVTNVGFHDTDGHSGDPYDTTDWTSGVSGEGVSWSTDDYADDPHANALRWGTLYNFRFDADAAPRSAEATLSLFAPGVPSTVSAPVSAPSDGGGCGAVSYCQTAPNSQGPGATISFTGSTSISANACFLHSTGGVPNQNGLFYYGASQVLLPFGDGFRCVGSGGLGTFRLNPPQPMNPSGDVTRQLDFTQPPANAGSGQIDPGSTWNFQFWYRDPTGPGGSGFNLSDGLSAIFCP